MVVQDAGVAPKANTRSSHVKSLSVANPSKGKQPMPSVSKAKSKAKGTDGQVPVNLVDPAIAESIRAALNC